MSFTIPRETFKRSTTQSRAELHVTGGVRAYEHQNREWTWYPALSAGAMLALNPQPIGVIGGIALDVGLQIFGLDELNGLETQLVSRVWTPLDAGSNGKPQPVDAWNAIAHNAEVAGNHNYAALARHIAYSMNAAGIRLRDASDDYHSQLIAAIHDKRVSGMRFANIPMQDIHLAFHSVLSELASARDYLATALARTLGAPDRIDAMNRFADWLQKPSQANAKQDPVIAAMLEAYDPKSTAPWLYELTEYRNTFLHRQPIGSQAGARFLQYNEVEHRGIVFPKIEMQLGEGDNSRPPIDALTRFIELYRAMTRLTKLASMQAPYPTEPPNLIVR